VTADGSKALENHIWARILLRSRIVSCQKVCAGAPAYEQGLNTGDQIVAFNNMRASKDFLDARIAEKTSG